MLLRKAQKNGNFGGKPHRKVDIFFCGEHLKKKKSFGGMPHRQVDTFCGMHKKRKFWREAGRAELYSIRRKKSKFLSHFVISKLEVENPLK